RGRRRLLPRLAAPAQPLDHRPSLAPSARRPGRWAKPEKTGERLLSPAPGAAIRRHDGPRIQRADLAAVGDLARHARRGRAGALLGAARPDRPASVRGYRGGGDMGPPSQARPVGSWANVDPVEPNE